MATQYYDVKITVLRRLVVEEIHEEFAQEEVHDICSKYREGQVFLSKNVQKPEGFCSWAWPVLQDKVLYLALGHDYPWIRQKGTEIVCCSDGLHPVLYKLERIEKDLAHDS